MEERKKMKIKIKIKTHYFYKHGQVLLAEYYIVFITRKAVKGSVIADHLTD